MARQWARRGCICVPVCHQMRHLARLIKLCVIKPKANVKKGEGRKTVAGPVAKPKAQPQPTPEVGRAAGLAQLKGHKPFSVGWNRVCSRFRRTKMNSFNLFQRTLTQKNRYANRRTHSG